MKTLQKQVFLSTEGDAYFDRNKSSILGREVHDLFKVYGKYLDKNSKILEIGCGCGQNLYYFHQTIGCEAYGVDPSVKAIKTGNELFKDIHISVGTADQLEFQEEYFDLVFFGVCLYLVDRTLLAKTIAEVDCVLKNKGILGVSDFDVKIPKKRPYKHKSGLISYKMDYSSLFLAYPHYSLIARMPKEVQDEPFIKEPSDRMSTSILFKDHDSAYVDEEDE